MADTETPLAGKTALVTGGSRGIGKQTALELARRGANVAIAARTVEPRKQLRGTIGETLAELEAIGVRALAVQADMGNPDDLERLVAETLAAFGSVDVLINNAAATGGRAWGAPLLELTRDEWMAQYAVNLHAPYTLVRALAPVMRDQGGGRIINVTTASPAVMEDQAAAIAARTGDAEAHAAASSGGSGAAGSAPAQGSPLGQTALAYLSSKAALDRFCQIVAPQLREMNVSITNVHPGAVHTEMVDLFAERGMPTDSFIPMDIPARALAYLATCADPMTYTGQLFVAERMVQELGL